MRLKITLEAPKQLKLPIHYSHILQGFIYGQLEPNLATWLHDEAYRYGKRKFTLFTFSRLTGAYQLDKRSKRIHFTGPVAFQLASYNSEVLSSLAEHLLTRQHLQLGQNEVQVTGVEILKSPCVNSQHPIKVKTLSPITTYSTFTKPTGAKLTHYYSPHDKDWNDMLLNNLSRKAGSLNWELDAKDTLQDAYIKPHRVTERDKKVLKYKGFVIEAWMGMYELNLPSAFFELAYDVGLGGKNAQGMGMIEVLKGAEHGKRIV